MPQTKTQVLELGAAGLLACKKYCLFTTQAHKAWILDSGASDHITPTLSLLYNVRPIKTPCYITMPNGKQALIKNIGSMHLASGLILQNVLHIPEFQFNLLSISKLTNQFAANVIFTPTSCLL